MQCESLELPILHTQTHTHSSLDRTDWTGARVTHTKSNMTHQGIINTTSNAPCGIYVYVTCNLKIYLNIFKVQESLIMLKYSMFCNWFIWWYWFENDCCKIFDHILSFLAALYEKGRGNERGEDSKAKYMLIVSYSPTHWCSILAHPHMCILFSVALFFAICFYTVHTAHTNGCAYAGCICEAALSILYMLLRL